MRLSNNLVSTNVDRIESIDELVDANRLFSIRALESWEV